MASGKGVEHASNILGALETSARPLSAYDLLDRLRPTGVSAPLTVYRALDKLIAAGKVHRIESLNAFVACCKGGHEHGDGRHGDASATSIVAFTICERCGAVDEFVDPPMFDRLAENLRGRRFTPRSSAIEVRGVCAGCLASGTPDAPTRA